MEMAAGEDRIPLAESLWLWARMLSSSSSDRMTPILRWWKKWRPRALRSPLGPVSLLLFFSAAVRSHCAASFRSSSLASSLALLALSPCPKSWFLNWSQYRRNPLSGFMRCLPKTSRSTVGRWPVTVRASLKVGLAWWGSGWPGAIP